MCLIKHAETLLRTKDCCTHTLLHAQQDALTYNKNKKKFIEVYETRHISYDVLV
jgi:hypothetical protein